MRKRLKFLALVAFAIITGCSAEVKPVDIEAGDMCSFCRMAISQKQYSAEIIAADGTVLKFDDIGCMIRYQQAATEKKAPTAVFIADSQTKTWLKAEEAFFVRSGDKTPMGSGIIAFGSAEKAGPAAARYSDLLK